MKTRSGRVHVFLQILQNLHHFHWVSSSFLSDTRKPDYFCQTSFGLVVYFRMPTRKSEYWFRSTMRNFLEFLVNCGNFGGNLYKLSYTI